MSVKEKGRGVERSEQLPVFFSDHGLQLKHVAHEQKLLSAKRFAKVATVDAQHFVDEVDDIGPHH